MRSFCMAAFAAVAVLGASAASAADRDSLMCYKAGTEFGGAVAHFNDQYTTNSLCGPGECPGESNTVDVKKVKDLCIAADVNGEGVTDESKAYVFYATKRTKGECSGDTSLSCGEDADCGGAAPCTLYTSKFDKKAAKNTSTLVTDGLETLHLDFGKEIGVLAPTAGGATPPTDGVNDYYKCYAVKPTKASCVGGVNDGQICKDPVVDCAGSPCTPNAKFPKETNFDDGGILPVTVNDDFLGGDTDLAVKKIKMFCQAADKNSTATPNPQAGLLCYAGKAVSGPGASFVAPPLIEASNQFHSAADYEVKKPEMFCNQACVDPQPFTPTNLVLRANSIQIGSNQTSGSPLYTSNALDIDSSLGFGGDATPDNSLSTLASTLNTPLADAVNDGSLNLIFMLDAFTNGAHIVSGMTADLSSPSNCPNAGDINDASKFCNYDVSVDVLTRSSCIEDAEIKLPITLSSTNVAPTAIGSGGGPTTTFAVTFSLGEAKLNVEAQAVRVEVGLTHDTTDVSAAQGIIAGAIRAVDLADAIGALTSECDSTSDNAGETCTSDSQCTSCDTAGGCCSLFSTLAPDELSPLVNLLVKDVDLDGHLNCMGGTNRGETCTMLSQCPDSMNGACQANESISLGLKFTAIDANIAGTN